MVKEDFRLNREKYYRFSAYLMERFECRVHKVSIDGGFSCPNKDGRISRSGCIYCDNRAFSFPVRKKSSDVSGRISNGTRPLELQIEEGIDFGKKRYGAEKFIIYFQAHTNTYAPVGVLKERYDIVRRFKDVAGIAIGTRPDCVNEEILDLINSYIKDYEVWIEYGMQSMHNKTLEIINRGHLYEDFLNAIRLTRARKEIKICAHIIIGLPGERRGDMLATARELGNLKVDGVKLHPLHVVRGTKLEELFNNGLYKTMELDEYADLVTEFLECLWPGTIIQRITADCAKELLVSPLWVLEKNRVLNKIDEVFLKKDRFQGRLYKEEAKECLTV